MPSNARDWRLVASARSGDRQAFGRLVQRHQQALAGFLWALGVRDLERRLVEVFVAAWRDLPQAGGYRCVRVWLFGLAARLNPALDDRHVLLLCGLEGFTWAEVAGMLDTTPAAVRRRFGRAKRRVGYTGGKLSRP
jgi:DNA-directed RNA polymerase specialized sigma24 family protein